MEFTTHFELHSQTTRLVEGASHGLARRSRTGFSPSVTSCSKELRPAARPKHPLQITTRAPGGSDFKFELLPLHSPLLRQSLLVSFPPLIDMLKFSGYPYLIRGQSWVRKAGCPAGVPGRRGGTKGCTSPGGPEASHAAFRGRPVGRPPSPSQARGV